jgi:hypothetical protein
VRTDEGDDGGFTAYFAPDAYARRVMVNSNARRFRRRVRHVLVDVVPER